ncbi:MAG: hypothetical protein ACR2GA_03050, partial [Chloroflexota bacterium]
MTGFIFLGVVLLLGPLALLFGVDSRTCDTSDGTGWLTGWERTPAPSPSGTTPVPLSREHRIQIAWPAHGQQPHHPAATSL